MELRQLRYFLAVANTLNFRKAAEVLNISQPPLSVQIRQLEEELGVQLFERSRGGTFLTNSGKILIDRAKVVLEAVEIAERDTRLAGDSRIGKLRIGWTSSGDFTSLLPNAIQAFRLSHEAISIDLCEVDSYRQVDMVARGELDLGIARHPEKNVPPELAISEFWRDRLVVAVGRDPAFDYREDLTVYDLRGADIITYLRGSGIGVNHVLRELCQREGFTPKIVQECSNTPMILGLVAAGSGVAVIPALQQNHGFDSLRFLPLLDRDACCALCLIRRRADTNPILSELVATIMQTARTVEVAMRAP